ETEEDVEVLCDGPPGLEELRMRGREVGARLHEHPSLADATPLQLGRELQAARRLIPEKIVGDEDVRSGGREVVADAVDGSKPDAAIMEGPHRRSEERRVGKEGRTQG